MSTQDTDQIARKFGELASMAGDAILKVQARGIAARAKADTSPVTDADEAAEAIILDGLAKLLPGVPVVAEECVSRGETPQIGRDFVLVDALDGTREFVAGRDEYTVNIALVRDGVPVCGAVFAPALQRLYFGAPGGAYRAALKAGHALAQAREIMPIHTRKPSGGRYDVLASRSHGDPDTEAFLARINVGERITSGSSLKFCVVAEGAADVYARLVSIMEWDVAAGHAVLAAAGGTMLTPQGGPVLYGKADKGFRHVPFMALGAAETARIFLD